MEYGIWNMEISMENRFHAKLKQKMDEFVHFVYFISKNFPKEETYGSKSQIRRAALSIVLNYIEGYARKRNLVYINFPETSYGSLMELDYLLDFSHEERWVNEFDYKKAKVLTKEIGAMLWSTIEGIKRKQ